MWGSNPVLFSRLTKRVVRIQQISALLSFLSLVHSQGTPLEQPKVSMLPSFTPPHILYPIDSCHEYMPAVEIVP